SRELPALARIVRVLVERTENKELDVGNVIAEDRTRAQEGLDVLDRYDPPDERHRGRRATAATRFDVGGLNAALDYEQTLGVAALLQLERGVAFVKRDHPAARGVAGPRVAREGIHPEVAQVAVETFDAQRASALTVNPAGHRQLHAPFARVDPVLGE